MKAINFSILILIYSAQIFSTTEEDKVIWRKKYTDLPFNRLAKRAIELRKKRHGEYNKNNPDRPLKFPIYHLYDPDCEIGIGKTEPQKKYTIDFTFYPGWPYIQNIDFMTNELIETKKYIDKYKECFSEEFFASFDEEIIVTEEALRIAKIIQQIVPTSFKDRLEPLGRALRFCPDKIRDFKHFKSGTLKSRILACCRQIPPRSVRVLTSTCAISAMAFLASKQKK